MCAQGSDPGQGLCPSNSDYVVKEALDQDPATALALHAPGVDLEIDPTQLSPEVSVALQDLLRQARHLVANSNEN